MLKFKIGDTVKITSGKDKARQGKLEKIFPKDRLALIPGINIYKRSIKGRPGQKGGIFEIPRPLPFSNIVLICPQCKKETRIGFKLVEAEKKRICKNCGKEIDKQ